MTTSPPKAKGTLLFPPTPALAPIRTWLGCCDHIWHNCLVPFICSLDSSLMVGLCLPHPPLHTLDPQSALYLEFLVYSRPLGNMRSQAERKIVGGGGLKKERGREGESKRRKRKNQAALPSIKERIT